MNLIEKAKISEAKAKALKFKKDHKTNRIINKLQIKIKRLESVLKLKQLEINKMNEILTDLGINVK